jgi:hypothetical protein
MINPGSHKEAKEYFIQKVLDQAVRENIQLSRAEKYMLQWSEKDPNFHVDQSLIAEFDKEITPEEYETKIAKLIIHAYKKDIKLTGTAKENYRQAYQALKERDNYLFIMVDKAVGRYLNKVRLFFGMYETGGPYIMKAILYAMLSLLLLCYVLLTLLGDRQLSFEHFKPILPQLIIGVVFLSLAVSNIKRYKKYMKDSSNNAFNPDAE